MIASQMKSKSNESNKAGPGSIQAVGNKFKSKFNQQTLKRLYPFLKSDEDQQKINTSTNIQSIEKISEKLISYYYKYHKEYTNEESRLFEFWSAMNVEEKEKCGLKWTLGDKNFEASLMDYFSEGKIIKRLSKIFENVCGYECFHPRPLHDYWFKQVTNETKYLKGLNKFDTDSLYKILEEYYEKRVEEDKKYEEEKKKDAKKEETLKKGKNKITKDQYENLKKKFDKLAKPKDKWRTGRAMINLRKQFQYDNIIKKMIKYEFETNRAFRFPEEYAIYNTQEMRKTLFKNSLEKKIKKENEDDIREMIQRTKFEDESKKRREEFQIQQVYKEDQVLEKFIKKMCIRYLHLTEARLTTGKSISINHFLCDMYKMMIKNHSKSTRRRFPKMKNYGKVKKSRFNNYPIQLKYYFFNLYKRLGMNQEGKLIFANYDNMPFWAPSLSNKCKIHSNNCPSYCKNNTHNQLINIQKSTNFNTLFGLDKVKLNEDERLHLWKRKDEQIMEERKKIFLCLSEAEHCTFEPKLNKEENQLTNEEIINKRISNKMWVTQMGGNFSSRFPLVYKEGIYKKAVIMFQEGRFTDVLNQLQNAFDLDLIKSHFDPKYAEIYKKKKLEENKKDGDAPRNDFHSMFNGGGGEKKKAEPDDFSNPKNKQICFEVYSILKAIDDHRKSKKREIKKIKDELKIVQETEKEIRLSKSISMLNTTTNSGTKFGCTQIGNNNIKTDTNFTSTSIKQQDKITNMNQGKNSSLYTSLDKHSIHKINYIKDRYFKFFKTMMCPLK
jgi:hypothetical protein